MDPIQAHHELVDRLKNKYKVKNVHLFYPKLTVLLEDKEMEFLWNWDNEQWEKTTSKHTAS